MANQTATTNVSGSPFDYTYYTYYDDRYRFPSIDAAKEILLLGRRPLIHANPGGPVPNKHYEFALSDSKIEFKTFFDDRDVLWLNVFNCFELLTNVYFSIAAAPFAGVCDVLEGFAAVAQMTVRPVVTTSAGMAVATASTA